MKKDITKPTERKVETKLTEQEIEQKIKDLLYLSAKEENVKVKKPIEWASGHDPYQKFN